MKKSNRKKFLQFVVLVLFLAALFVPQDANRLLIAGIALIGIGVTLFSYLLPLFTALSELCPLKIQYDLPKPLNLLILLPALFPERIHGALQHGELPPELFKNLHRNLGLFHAACTTFHT